jgi:hypothetical protein
VTVVIPNVSKEGQATLSHTNVVYLDLLVYTQRAGSIPNSKRDSWLLGRFRRLKCGIVVGGFLCTIVAIRDAVITDLMYPVSCRPLCIFTRYIYIYISTFSAQQTAFSACRQKKRRRRRSPTLPPGIKFQGEECRKKLELRNLKIGLLAARCCQCLVANQLAKNHHTLLWYHRSLSNKEIPRIWSSRDRSKTRTEPPKG